MDVLVVGSGGREHALCWKLAQSSRVGRVFCAPGNAGTAQVAQNVQIKADDIQGLAGFVEKQGIGLTIVGPEAPMIEGIVDLFNKRKLRIFGPSAAAAMIEGSKAFAKEIMNSAKVPTAAYETIEGGDAEEVASRFGKAAVKADGLAFGKGVIICRSPKEIVDAIGRLRDASAFGDSGKRIVVEELLEGEEASILAFCDGRTARLMIASQDHKRIFDGDKGGNTGGMGAYAPAPIVSGMEEKIHDEVFVPVLAELERRGTPYVGVLYAGLMVKEGEFRVLEFNARFGDPEAQPVLSLLESDLVDVVDACIDGKLEGAEIKWRSGAACCVVMVSQGYPGKYEKGKEIRGLEDAAMTEGVRVFHSGTRKEGGLVLTDGGRVLGVTAVGESIEDAVNKAYLGVSKISFDGMHYRKDIGKAALNG